MYHMISRPLQYCFFFSGVLFSLNAQKTPLEGKIDSLLNECRRVSSNPDSLAIVAKELLKVGMLENSDRALFEGYFAGGLAKYRNGRLEDAVLDYDSALRFSSRDVKGHYRAHTRILRNQGIVLTRLSRYEEAKDSFFTLIELAEQSGDEGGKAYAYNQLGVVSKYENRWEEAIDFYVKALTVADSLEIGRLQYNVLTNLGIAQNALGSDREAMKYQRMALRVAKKLNDRTFIMRAKNNLAIEYRNQGTYDSAMILFRENLQAERALNLKGEEPKTLQNIGNTYLLMKRYDSSISYLKNAHRLSLLTPDTQRQAQSVRLLGTALFETEALGSALLCYDSALNIVVRNRLYSELQKTYKNLAEVYEAMGDFKNANKFLRHETSLKDSLYSLEGLKTLNEILTKYEVSEKEEEIGKLSYYRRLLTPVGIGSILLFISLLIVLTKWKKSKVKLMSENEELNKEIERSKTEILELKSRAIISVDEIVSIKADGHYLEFYLTSKSNPEIDRNRIKEVLEVLPPKFVQIHRSYIVNIEHIKVKYADKVLLKDGQELPVSRTYKATLNKMMKS